MGINNLTVQRAIFTLLIALSLPCFAKTSATLKHQPWPQKTPCSQCLQLQFGPLDMKIPTKQFSKLLILPGVSTNINFLFNSNKPEPSAELYTIPPDKFLKMYQKAGFLKGLGITTNEQLLDHLCHSPGKNKRLATIRHIERFDIASEFIKMSKGHLHAFWIKSHRHDSAAQRIFFVIDGDDTLYTIEGQLSHRFLNAILSNLKIEKIP